MQVTERCRGRPRRRSPPAPAVVRVTYDKDLFVVETSSPFTAADGDLEGNFPSTDPSAMPDLAAYPATPEGQARFFEQLRAILLAVPGDRGLGFFHWEPGLLPGVPWAPGEGGHAERQPVDVGLPGRRPAVVDRVPPSGSEGAAQAVP